MKIIAAMLVASAICYLAQGCSDRGGKKDSTGTTGTATGSGTSTGTSTDTGGPALAYEVAAITHITDNGGRLGWSPDGALIAYDRKEADKYFDVCLMAPDGSNVRCLTDKPGLVPQKHNGNPAWHPSGEYIIFQVEKAEHFGNSTYAHPGLGIYNDLWVMNADGSEFHQLTDLPVPMYEGDPTPMTGVLHPHFSHDGTRVTWAECTEVGSEADNRGFFGGACGIWQLCVADFLTGDGVPRLANKEIYKPGDATLYETHGFSPDDGKILFTGNLLPNQLQVGMDIYALDLHTDELTRLTDTDNDWEEHGQYTPDGMKIVYIANGPYQFDPDKVFTTFRAEHYIMDADGSNKRRLTYFNEPGYPEYLGLRAICSDSSWSPDGRRLATKVKVYHTKWRVKEHIYIIDFR